MGRKKRQPDLDELLAGVDDSSRTAANLGDYPVSRRLLNHGEEMALSRQAQTGDLRARDTLIECNLRLVMSLAKRFSCRSLTIEDLIQEGVLGLIEAINKYDPDRGNRFSTYATYWIRQAMIRAIEKQDRIIRLPSYGCNAEQKIADAETELRQTLDREPSVEEIARHTGLSRRLVYVLRMMSPEPLSLDEMIGDQEDTALGEILEDQTALEPEDGMLLGIDRERLYQVLETLKERERQVIIWRFGLYGSRRWSLKEIAEEFAMSREGVRHMQNRVLKRLRPLLETMDLFMLSDSVL